MRTTTPSSWRLPIARQSRRPTAADHVDVPSQTSWSARCGAQIFLDHPRPPCRPQVLGTNTFRTRRVPAITLRLPHCEHRRPDGSRGDFQSAKSPSRISSGQRPPAGPAASPTVKPHLPVALKPAVRVPAQRTPRPVTDPPDAIPVGRSCYRAATGPQPGATSTTSSTGPTADPTSLDNGVLLCHTHHTLIHRREWQVQLGHDRHHSSPHLTGSTPPVNPEPTPPTSAADRCRCRESCARHVWLGQS